MYSIYSFKISILPKYFFPILPVPSTWLILHFARIFSNKTVKLSIYSQNNPFNKVMNKLWSLECWNGKERFSLYLGRENVRRSSAWTSVRNTTKFVRVNRSARTDLVGVHWLAKQVSWFHQLFDHFNAKLLDNVRLSLFL